MAGTESRHHVHFLEPGDEGETIGQDVMGTTSRWAPDYVSQAPLIGDMPPHLEAVFAGPAGLLHQCERLMMTFRPYETNAKGHENS